MQRHFAIIAAATTALMFLSGCAGISNSTGAATSTSVAGAEVALTAAEKAAFTYARLPQCPVGAPVCSDAATIAKIKFSDNTAFAAVKAARLSKTDVDVAIANAAIAALVSIVPDTGPVPASAH